MIDIIKGILSPSMLHRTLNQFGSVSMKSLLLYSLIGMCVVAIVVIVKHMNHKEIAMSDVLTGIVLSVYISIIIQLTLVCRQSGSRIGIDLDMFNGLRGELDWYHLMMWSYTIMNCLLFVPYGFVWSMFSFINERSALIQLITVTLLSFMSSMLLECTQLVTQRGYWEVQDLTCNTLGGILGWMLFAFIIHVVKIRKKKHKGDLNC